MLLSKILKSNRQRQKILEESHPHPHPLKKKKKSPLQSSCSTDQKGIKTDLDARIVSSSSEASRTSGRPIKRYEKIKINEKKKEGVGCRENRAKSVTIPSVHRSRRGLEDTDQFFSSATIQVLSSL